MNSLPIPSTPAEDQHPKKNSLGSVLWLFIAMKSIGVLLNLVQLAMTFYIGPAVARAGATSGFAYDWISEAGLPLAEIIFVALGFTLIIRRRVSMRQYWQLLLTITIIFQLVHAFTEEEWFASISFALFNLGWLSYWHFSAKPAELITGGRAS